MKKQATESDPKNEKTNNLSIFKHELRHLKMSNYSQHLNLVWYHRRLKSKGVTKSQIACLLKIIFRGRC
jgi:hypothetical protein